jgi:hypothetical protein
MGSANTPPNASLAQTLQQAGIAAFQVSGTGTSLDGKWVLGAVTIDPLTGLPGAIDQGTDGASAPSPASGGTGTRGWLSSLTKAIQDVWDSTNHLLKVSLVTALSQAVDSITTYPVGHNVTVISTATDTVVKSGAGTIRKIWAPGGTMGAVTVYDNTSAAVPTLWPTLTPVAGWVLLEDVAFNTGCTVRTAAATVVVVVWR